MGKDKEGARTMGEGKKEEPVERLEREFHNFLKDWTEFRSNEFRHLTGKVDGLADSVAVFIARDVASDASMRALEKSIHVMDDNILEILKRLK